MEVPKVPIPENLHADKANKLVWFAGMAMQAIIAKQPSVTDTPVEREEVALWSFRMAEAMIEAQKQLNLD
jgi:hypothetical protein